MEDQNSKKKLFGEVLISETLRLEYPHKVFGSRIWLKKCPLNTPTQALKKFSVKTVPDTRQSEFLDRFGNKVILISKPSGHKSIEISIRARVALNPKPKKQNLKTKARANDGLELFREESGKVILNRVTQRIAESLRKSAPSPTGALLAFMRGWVHTQMKYKTGVTEPHTDSYEALRLREGVCQDLTHVFLSLARSLGIPARYIGGYQVGGTEMHSWAQAYSAAAGWATFDPTESSDDLPKVAVALGRDYLDASPLDGNFCSAQGQGILQSKIQAKWVT